jgi:hypothetical protein
MASVPGHGRSTNAHLTGDSHIAPLAAREESSDLLVSLTSQAVWHETCQPYDIDHYGLHTHPDLVERLWELGRDCPSIGRWTTPATSGIVRIPDLSISPDPKGGELIRHGRPIREPVRQSATSSPRQPR